LQIRQQARRTRVTRSCRFLRKVAPLPCICVTRTSSEKAGKSLAIALCDKPC
jgi:hypothetical protein